MSLAGIQPIDRDRGTLYGISVGPGDPELITLKGLKQLQRSPVVAFPQGVGGKLGMAQRAIAPWLQPQQEQLPLDFPYVRDLEVLQAAWNAAADRVWSHLSAGQDVAFTCEGDVSFYSTFTYLAQTLQDRYPEAKIATIPGVSSPMAAASALGLPLTVRAQRLAILPALYAISEFEATLDWADVVILLKVNSVYETVWQVLRDRQLLARAWVVERATLPEQVVYFDLRDRPCLHLPYFAILGVQVMTLERGDREIVLG